MTILGKVTVSLEFDGETTTYKYENVELVQHTSNLEVAITSKNRSYNVPELDTVNGEFKIHGYTLPTITIEKTK